MNNDSNCPNCRAKRSVTEFDNEFQCGECGNWGYSVNSLPYTPEQPQCWNQDGQVYRKSRAA